MSKIFFEGDLQIYKAESEYNEDSARFNAIQLYIDWVLNNPKLNNKDVTYFSLGDLFEVERPFPSENELALYYLTAGKWKKKYLLSGNHDYNRIKNEYSIDMFKRHLDITIIKKPQKLKLEGLNTLCLPYYYDNIYSDLKPMKEEYEAKEGTYDLVISHIQDETQSFGDSKSIDISKLKGQRIQGHLHAVKDNISGYAHSPIPHKKSEVLEKRYCFLYDTETKEIEKIEIPNFLNYEEIEYPNPIKEDQIHEHYTLYTIKESVNKETTIDFYRKQIPNIYIKEIQKKKLQTVSESYEASAKKSIQDFFEDYSLENKLNKELETIILEKIT